MNRTFFSIAATAWFAAACASASDLSVRVIPDKPFVARSESVRWTVLVSNASDKDSTNTKLRITLPENIYGVEPDEFNYEPATDTFLYYQPGQVVEYDIGKMPPGYSLPIRVTTWPDSDATAGTRLVMSAQAESEQSFADGQGDTLVTSHQTNLQINAPTMHAESGQSFSFSATYSYEGGTPLENATLVMTLPGDVVVTAATQGFSYDGPTLTWKLGTLLKGDNGARWFDLRSFSDAKPGTILLVTAEIHEGTVIRNRAIWPLVVPESAGLTCRTYASQRQVESGNSMVWNVEVVNQSQYPATGVRLMVNLPTDVRSLEPKYFSPQPATDTFIYYDPGQRVHYNLGTLNPGARKLFQIRAWPEDDAPAGGLFLVNANTDSDNGIRGTSSQATVALGKYAPMAPDIRMECPEFKIVADGQKTPVAFGSRKVGATVTKRFVVRNLGALDLSVSKIMIVGANASDWTVGSLGKNLLSCREKTTFPMTFKPKGKGIRKATLRVYSNDSDESPYDIKLTGTGS